MVTVRDHVLPFQSAPLGDGDTTTAIPFYADL